MKQAGELLSSRYRLQEPVGRGGMGSVWRAADTVLGRDVAVKLLGGHGEDPTARARFRREALVLAQLTHPRLGNVYDYAEDPLAGAYIVMEYLYGETLEARIARTGPLPPEDAAEIAAQVAEGLGAAHQAGVVHRDVKPANVILTVHGVKVVDFGIALAAGDSRLTGVGNLIATAGYVAPECGRGAPASPASDVYSLGVVLYEMLTGRPPFTGTDAADIVAAHVHAGVPPLPTAIPGGIARCCMRALAKDPAERLVPALRLVADLRDAVNDRLEATRPDDRDATRNDLGERNGTMVMSPVTTAADPYGQASRPGPLGFLTSRVSRTGLIAVGAAVALVAAAGGVWAMTSSDVTGTHHPAGAASAAAHSPTSHPTQVVDVPKADYQWAVPLAATPGAAPSPPVVMITPGSSTVVAEEVGNSLSQPAGPTGVTLTGPSGWSVAAASPSSTATVPAGGHWTAAWKVTPPSSVSPGAYQLSATTSCGNGCAAPAITVQVIVTYPSFTATFDNAGIAPAAAATGIDFDGVGESYQQEALAAVGYLPGAQISVSGIPFSWPAAPTGQADNTVALGQTFLMSGVGSYLAFLGAAGYGPAGGDGVVYYSDGTQQPYRLVLDDWISTQATAGDDQLAVTTGHWNSVPPDGGAPQADHQVSVFFAAVPLQAGKTVVAVTLPTTAAPAENVASLHLFAATIK